MTVSALVSVPGHVVTPDVCQLVLRLLCPQQARQRSYVSTWERAADLRPWSPVPLIVFSGLDDHSFPF